MDKPAKLFLSFIPFHPFSYLLIVLQTGWLLLVLLLPSLKSRQRTHLSFDEWNVWYKTMSDGDMDGMIARDCVVSYNPATTCGKLGTTLTPIYAPLACCFSRYRKVRTAPY